MKAMIAAAQEHGGIAPADPKQMSENARRRIEEMRAKT
jgi:hypothetical protein